MYTTALVVQQGERTICLYFAGRAHAGENLEALLTHREADRGKPLVMSDALAAMHADEAALIRCHCLAHGRRKFSELEEVFPEECEVVIEALKQVFDHEEEARVQQMNPTERLAYHQPIVGRLWTRSSSGSTRRSMSAWWNPTAAWAKPWRICGPLGDADPIFAVEGAPLDNNMVERALKLFIRQRKNTLFYATEHSAYIASVLTSLIATCLHAGSMPWSIWWRCRSTVRRSLRDPAAWLPWNYHATLAPP